MLYLLIVLDRHFEYSASEDSYGGCCAKRRLAFTGTSDEEVTGLFVNEVGLKMRLSLCAR